MKRILLIVGGEFERVKRSALAALAKVGLGTRRFKRSKPGKRAWTRSAIAAKEKTLPAAGEGLLGRIVGVESHASLLKIEFWTGVRLFSTLSFVRSPL